MEYDIKTMPNDIGLIRLYWKEKFPNDDLYAVRLYKKYNELLSHLKDIDLTKIIEEEDETDLTGEVACAGGACEL